MKIKNIVYIPAIIREGDQAIFSLREEQKRIYWSGVIIQFVIRNEAIAHVGVGKELVRLTERKD